MTRTLLFLGLVVSSSTSSTSGTTPDDVGVNVSFYSGAYDQAATMAAAGLRWVRLDLAWSAVETEPGRYDFGIWDRFLDSFEPFRIRVLFILDYGNDLHERGFPPATETGRSAFASFAAAAARHFRGRAMWEIWNEPNLPRYWAGSPDAAAYVALARAAAVEIRREDPGAWILGPSLGGSTFDLDYLEATFALGLLDVVDAVSVHPYGASHPEAATEFYDQVRQLIGRYSPRREVPIVVSEWGYPVEGLGAEGQADFLVRALTVNRRAGIPLTIWYNWQEPITPWHSFGLLDVRGQPKPAYDALARMSAAQPPGKDGAEWFRFDGWDQDRGLSSMLASVVHLSTEPRVGEPFLLRPGETASVEGADFSLTFEEVESDSRCPRDVQCIRAGEAEVVLRLRTTSGEAIRLSLEVPPGGGATGAFREHTIRVLALEPQTESDRRIGSDDYVVQLRVDAANESTESSTKRLAVEDLTNAFQ